MQRPLNGVLSKFNAYPIGWNTVHYDGSSSVFASQRKRQGFHTRLLFLNLGLAIAFVIGQAASILVTAFVNWYWVLPTGNLSALSVKVPNLHGNTTSDFRCGELISRIIHFTVIALIHVAYLSSYLSSLHYTQLISGGSQLADFDKLESAKRFDYCMVHLHISRNFRVVHIANVKLKHAINFHGIAGKRGPGSLI